MTDKAIKKIGDLLKEAREGASLTLECVANDLKIRLLYLKEIEEGKTTLRPDGYTVGYINKYAAFLDVDISEALQAFKDESDDKFYKLKRIANSNEPRWPLPTRRVISLSSLLLACLYMISEIWY